MIYNFPDYIVLLGVGDDPKEPQVFNWDPPVDPKEKPYNPPNWQRWATTRPCQ